MIKSSLLRLESAYKIHKTEEDHFRFDSEEQLYKPIYEHVDLHPMLRDYSGELGVLGRDHFDVFWAAPKFMNGLLMVILEFSKMDKQLMEMKIICEEMITKIDSESRL